MKGATTVNALVLATWTSRARQVVSRHQAAFILTNGGLFGRQRVARATQDSGFCSAPQGPKSFQLSQNVANRVPRAGYIQSFAKMSSSAASAGVDAHGSDTSNPLLQQEGLPKFQTIEASSVVPAITELLEKLEKDFESLENDLAAADGDAYTFSGVLERMEVLSAPLQYAWGVVGHLMGVKNSDELREAHKTMQPKVVQALQKLGQSQPVYKALKALAGGSQRGGLSEAQQRIVDSKVKDMDLAGVGLEGEAKQRFNAIELELAEIATKFSNNVLDANKAFSLTLRDPAEVDGLPPSAKGLLAQQAKTAGEEGATPDGGPWRVTLDLPSYLPCMQHLKNRDIREKLYKASVGRAASGETNNEPLISRILELKQEKAQLLGYKTYAEVSLATKMADSVEAVDALTSMLRDRSYPFAVKELQDLKDYARGKGLDDQLQLWDVTFWSERRKEELFSFSEEELRPYFPLPAVLKGMFSLAGRLFGVDITSADGAAEVWNSDVRFFNIKDKESGEHMAQFYLDPYSRPENKRGGAWMDVCVGRSKVLKRSPVAYLTCNGSPPVGDTPSLMTFQEVETLFHEFGHGLQHMLTKIEDADAAGINNVEWDAVELPSQFMENWCYHKPTVYEFARHFETGEPLPDDLFEKLKAQRTYMAGTAMLRQLYFGQMDMELHHRYDTSDKSLSPFDVQRRVSERFTVIKPLPEDRFLCAFSHIFASGYSAGYYSYKWAEVMSADAFSAFEDAGLDDEQAVAQVGRRFAQTVLGLGGGRHPSEVFREFRGRDPTPDALLRHSGLLEIASSL